MLRWRRWQTGRERQDTSCYHGLPGTFWQYSSTRKPPRGSKEGHPPALGGPPPFGRWSPFPGRSSKTFLSFFLFLWRRCRRPWRLLALSGAAMVCKVW